MEWTRVRRRTLSSVTALALLGAVAACGVRNDPNSYKTLPGEGWSYPLHFLRLENQFDATLGVYALDTGTGDEISYKPDERLGYASTFKAFLAAVFLRDYTFDELDEVVEFTEEDLEPHAPVAEENVDSGMTLLELGEAAVRYSDNTAANLLLAELGGLEVLNEILVELGDDVTDMHQYEVNMGEFTEGETSDTTTPRAFAENLDAFVFGDVLEEDKREVFTEWLQTNETGGDLVEAGVPADWVVGGTTGTGVNHGIRNNIVVLWPPESDPIVLAVMTKRPDPDAEPDDALLAEAAAIVVDEFSDQ